MIAYFLGLLESLLDTELASEDLLEHGARGQAAGAGAEADGCGDGGAGDRVEKRGQVTAALAAGHRGINMTTGGTIKVAR